MILLIELINELIIMMRVGMVVPGGNVALAVPPLPVLICGSLTPMFLTGFRL